LAGQRTRGTPSSTWAGGPTDAAGALAGTKEHGMQIQVLGPLEVTGTAGLAGLGGVKQRAVLAMLALDLNQVVSIQFLVEGLWGDQAPASATNAVQVYVSRLRKALQTVDGPDGPGAAVLQRRGSGYRLELDPERLDLHRFQRLAREGAQALRPAPARSAGILREALSLWRGKPLEEFADQPFAYREIPRLEQERLAALEAYLQAELALGRHAQLVGELETLIAEHPLHEGAHRLLMLSLYRSGRQAEALEAYRRARHILAEGLGIDPGRPLRELEGAILNQDRFLDWIPPDSPTLQSTAEAPPAPAVVARPEELHERALRADASPGTAAPQLAGVDGPGRSPPAQLPRDIPRFTGRDEELDRLLAMIRDDGGRVALIVGTAGVGKTTLALHGAHQTRDRFPDGQLHANLRGFDPARAPMEPAEALQGFLEALGVPPGKVPANVEAQSALYRTLLQDRRVLVLLDNARDAEQVRPLLPGSAACQVIVTSRNSLSGLVAEVGAQPLHLQVLAPQDARQLLASRLGADRVASEPEAVDEIIRTCAGLPLALAIVGARGVGQPRFPLTVLAKQLRVSTEGLDVFVEDDELTDVRAVISWSYAALHAEAARLFRLTAIHPGPDMAIPAAASLLGRPVPEARSAMVALSRAHLVEERSPGRFGFHDLLRAYAAETAVGTDSETERRAALHRVLAHYLCTAHVADRLLSPAREPLATVPVPEIAGVAAVPLDDRQEALDWFVAELPTLFAAVDLLPAGLDDSTWDLVWGLEAFLDRRGQWHERRYGEAYRRFASALRRAQRAGGQVEQARLHIRLNWVLERLGRFAEGLEHARQALELFTALDNPAGIAHSMNAIGWCHAQLGAYDDAVNWCESALRLNQELGQRDGEAHTWDSLGYAHDRLGAHLTAIACYRRAVNVWRDLGVGTYEADTLDRLARAYEAAGDSENEHQARRSAALIRADLLAHRWP
jgi:DNA-binding SARP family transcriptional activator